MGRGGAVRHRALAFLCPPLTTAFIRPHIPERSRGTTGKPDVFTRQRNKSTSSKIVSLADAFGLLKEGKKMRVEK